MKIMHTGDWHIGKLVHGIHMTEDQAYILKQLVQLIEYERPDVLIVAGDIYDRAIPPVEAVELLDKILSQLTVELNLHVILIAGNHDSPDRLGFGSQMLKAHGLHIVAHLEHPVGPIVLHDAYGSVHFYPIPYSEPATVKAILNDDGINSHETAMSAVLAHVKTVMDPSVRNVCIAHGFVIGTETLETSESERPLTIGGSEYVGVEHFEGFDYVALGHLHKAQKVKKETIRYGGSLMKYAFSEAQHKKSITLINMEEKGKIAVAMKHLEPLRDMRVIQGDLESLMDPSVYSGTQLDDYIMAILTDKDEPVDVMSKLRSIYPNILRIERADYQRVAGEAVSSASGAFSKKSPLSLYSEFYENVTGEFFDGEKNQVIAEALDALLQKGRVL